MFKFDKFKIFSPEITILQISPFHVSTCCPAPGRTEHFQNDKMKQRHSWEKLAVCVHRESNPGL